jgi:hypothetical protein
VHPSHPDKQTHPDFLASLDGDPAFYLESTTICKKPENTAELRRYSKAIDAINALDLPNCYLSMNIRTKGNATPSSKKICQFLSEQYAEWKSTTHEKLGISHRATYDHMGWRIEFGFIFSTNKDDGSRTIGIYPSDGVSYGVSELLRTKLDAKKSRKYGLNELPYIVAVNSLDSIGFEVDDIVKGLFGHRFHTKWLPAITEKAMPNNEGAWLTKRGYSNKGQSALLFAEQLVDWTMFSTSPILFHHPCAERVLDKSLLRMTQLLPVHEPPTPMYYRVESGERGSSILGIAESLAEAANTFA